MNRDQKAAAIEEIAGQIRESHAVLAVDPTGLSVTGAAEVRTRLRDADTTLRVVKNTLTERAADAAEAEHLKELLTGATALAFVRGDIAAAAKALADYQRDADLLPFKGGLMDGDALDADQLRAISRLPSRDALYGQLVGVVASPITGLARGLNGLLSGLAVALGGVLEKKESGELPSGEAPAAAAEPAEAQEEAAPAAEAAAEEQPEPPAEPEAAPATDTPTDQDAEAPEPAASPEEPAEGAPDKPETQED